MELIGSNQSVNALHQRRRDGTTDDEYCRKNIIIRNGYQLASSGNYTASSTEMKRGESPQGIASESLLANRRILCEAIII